MLLEVLVSAVIVALIAAGTYTGLAASGSATSHERSDAQAVVLSQQDEERLRGLSVKELGQLGEEDTTYTVSENGECVEEKSGGWYYYSGESEWKSGCEAELNRGAAYTGTVYSITPKAEYVSAANETLACESGEAKDYIRTSSTVTWTGLGRHEVVKQSSIVDEPPTGMLMVKVKNRNNEPVSGATVEAFDPTSSAKATASETTPASGCVIIGGLEEGEVKLIASKEEWVTRDGKTAPEKLTSVKKGSLAEAEFTLERPGTIGAEFISNTTDQSVSSFTFVAYQSEIASSAPLFVGGSASSASTTANLTSLFPFALPVNKPDKYTVYAGDCEANEPALATKGSGSEEVAETAQVEPFNVETVKKVKIPLPKAEVTVYEGASGGGAKVSTGSGKVINSECKGKTAQNYTSGVSYEHAVTITNGELTPSYLPYAKTLELCVTAKIGSKYYRNQTSFTNTKRSGTSTAFYLKNTGTGHYSESSSSLSC